MRKKFVLLKYSQHVFQSITQVLKLLDGPIIFCKQSKFKIDENRSIFY